MFGSSRIPVGFGGVGQIRTWAFVVNSVVDGNTKRDLQRPINGLIRYEDGCALIDCDDLGIFSYGHSAEEALCDFGQQLLEAYDGLKDEPDESLTLDARNLKEKLASYLEA